MSQCCQPSGDDNTPAGRLAGLIALGVIILLGWGTLAAVLILS